MEGRHELRAIGPIVRHQRPILFPDRALRYLIVFFGVMLGTVGIRFPSAAILLTSGVLIQQGHLGLGGTVAFGVLGAIVGI